MLDKLKAERERGITMDIRCSVKVEDAKFTCTVMEAPGHRDFIVMVGGGTGELEAARLVKLNI